MTVVEDWNLCGKSKDIWMNSSRSNQGSAFKHLPPLIHLGRLKCRLSLMGQRIDLFDFNWGSTDVKHGAVWQIFQAFVLGGLEPVENPQGICAAKRGNFSETKFFGSK